MKNKDFKKNILNKIDKEDIKRLPKWHFLVKNYLFWIFSIVSLFIGSLAISIIILNLLQIDITIAERASGGLFRHVIFFAPYLWISLLIIFMIFVLKNFMHTKYGYRYSNFFIFIISLIIGGLVGLLMYFSGVAQNTDNYIGKVGRGFYTNGESHREEMWTQSEKGMLAGIVSGISGDSRNEKEFNLVDFEGKTWSINSERLNDRDRAILSVAPKVAIIGIKLEDGSFEACAVIPWSNPLERRQMKKDVLKFGEDHNVKFTKMNIFELQNNACREEKIK